MSQSIDRTPSERVDVCIVGSGVAGALVAYSLAERGYEIVVLEAGKRFDYDSSATNERLEQAVRPDISRENIWEMGGPRDRYTTDLDEKVDFELNNQRLKGVGGTTLMWSGYTPRLHEKDFEMESRYGLAADWPISYDDLRPYYAEAEREMGIAGSESPLSPPREEPYPMEPFPPSYTDRLFEDALEQLGIHMHSLPQARNTEAYDGRSTCLGYSTCTPFCPSGAQYKGLVHVRKAEEEGARVIDRAPVQRIEHGDDGKRVEAVVYATPDGEQHRQEARHVVVACGGIETPRLLLLSASDAYPDGLANQSGAVGRYFHASLLAGTSAELDQPAQQEPVFYRTSHSNQFYEHDDPTPGSIRLVFDNNNPPSPVRMALRGGDSGLQEDLFSEVTGDQWGDELLESMRQNSPKNHRTVRIDSQVEQLPQAENRVMLDPSTTDNFGNPVPKITFSVGSHAVQTIERALEIHRNIFNEMNAEITYEQDPLNQHIGNHHKGTTRMGENPETSVVNEQCQAHDLENLWISSSSVFTTGGAVNPTLTIAALSLKTADHIQEEL